MTKYCALNTSPNSTFLDHITPLASLLDIPLVISDEKNVALTAKYYPEVPILYWPDIEFRLHDLTAFDALIACDFWPTHIKNVFLQLYHKEMHLLFCPHGQSDKGYGVPILTPYAWQESILIYGDLLREMLQELNLWQSIQSHAEVGNFRFAYYQKHQKRLLTQVQDTIFSKLPAVNKTILYAPTWNDADHSDTCADCSEQLLQTLPPDWNLLIKPHPSLADRNPALFYRALSWESKYRNCAIVEETPFIYPLLDLVDIYLGDYSSVGYDALFLRKPMCFLSKQHISRPRLHQCGIPYDGSFRSIEQALHEADHYRAAQDALANKAFAPISDLKTNIEKLICK